MGGTTNGWDIWYSRLDPEWSDEFVPQSELQRWGEEFQQLVRLSDHSGYTQAEPLPLEDAMTLAFVLDQTGVNVEAVLELCRTYTPFELDDTVTIPLCFLLDPLGHVDGLIEQLQDMWQLSEPDMEEIRQGIEAMGGTAPEDTGTLLEIFRTGLLTMVRFLAELERLLGEYGQTTLNAWWQGRLIGLLREENEARPRHRPRAGKGKGNVPDVFRDLIQGLDLDED